jgi:hypothetical protein
MIKPMAIFSRRERLMGLGKAAYKPVEAYTVSEQKLILWNDTVT